MRTLLGIASALASILIATAGHAAEASPEGEAAPPVAQEANEAARLGAFLERRREDRSQLRLATGITGLVVASVSIPLGVVMLSRDDERDHRASTYGGMLSLGLGAGALLGAGLLLVTSEATPLAELSDRYTQMKAEGASEANIVTSVEALWRDRAERERNLRKIAAVTSMVAGGLGLGLGTYLALSDPTRRTSRAELDGYAAGAIVFGGVLSLAGAQLFVFRGPTELSYEAYRVAKPTAGGGSVRVSVGAVPSGASLGFVGSF